MKEKKLTDKELVKNIEYCMTHDDCSEDCPMGKVQGCMLIMLEQSLDLIHRLQDESAKQKAEIERLTEENAILKGNPTLIAGRSLGKTIRAKLLAFDKMKEQNAELQKQVDELTKERDKHFLKATLYYAICKGYGIDTLYDEELDVANKGVEVK